MYKADKKFMAMIEEFIPEEQRMKMTFMEQVNYINRMEICVRFIEDEDEIKKTDSTTPCKAKKIT